eukprot:sb/3466450/
MSDDEQKPPSPPPPEWVKIQHKTFTRWTNEQLKARDLHIEELPEGLKDGVVLVNLVEMLTEKACPRRYSKKPSDGFFVTQDSIFGNLILSVIPRFNADGSLGAGNLPRTSGGSLVPHSHPVWRRHTPFDSQCAQMGSAAPDILHPTFLIQHKTFTRWTNEQLKARDLHIEELPEGLKDGVVLVNLVEMLTEKACPRRYSKKPRRVRFEYIHYTSFGTNLFIVFSAYHISSILLPLSLSISISLVSNCDRQGSLSSLYLSLSPSISLSLSLSPSLYQLSIYFSPIIYSLLFKHTIVSFHEIKLSFGHDEPTDGKPKVTAKQHVQNLVTEKLGQMTLPGGK